MKTYIRIIGGLILLTKSSFAFDITQAYQSALAYNADYLAAIAKNKAGQEPEVQSRASLLPQLSANTAINENYFNSGMTFYYHQPTAGAQLQQTVFDFNKFSQYTKNKYSTIIANLQLQNAKQQLIVTISQAYFDILYAKDTLDAIITTKKSLERQLKQAKSAFEVGTVTIADVNDAQSAYDNASAQEIQAQNDLINRKNIFRNLTGLNPDLIQPLISSINLIEPEYNSADKWSELASHDNLNIKIAQKQVEMANQDVSIARSGHLPTVNVVGNYQYQGDVVLDAADPGAMQFISQNGVAGTPLSSYSNATVGLQLSLPLYQGGAVNSQVRQAIANYEQSQQQLVSIKRKTDQDIKNAFWQVQNGISLVKARTQALKSAKIKLDSDQLGYKVGIRNSIDLVNSQKAYYQAMQDYNQSRYNYLVNQLQLEYLCGKIDEQYLKLINQNIKNGSIEW